MLIFFLLVTCASVAGVGIALSNDPINTQESESKK